MEIGERKHLLPILTTRSILENGHAVNESFGVRSLLTLITPRLHCAIDFWLRKSASMLSLFIAALVVCVLSAGTLTVLHFQMKFRLEATSGEVADDAVR